MINATPRTVRTENLREQIGQDRNAAARDRLLDQLIVFVTDADASLEAEESEESEEAGE